MTKGLQAPAGPWGRCHPCPAPEGFIPLQRGPETRKRTSQGWCSTPLHRRQGPGPGTSSALGVSARSQTRTSESRWAWLMGSVHASAVKGQLRGTPGAPRVTVGPGGPSRSGNAGKQCSCGLDNPTRPAPRTAALPARWTPSCCLGSAPPRPGTTPAPAPCSSAGPPPSAAPRGGSPGSAPPPTSSCIPTGAPAPCGAPSSPPRAHQASLRHHFNGQTVYQTALRKERKTEQCPGNLRDHKYIITFIHLTSDTCPQHSIVYSAAPTRRAQWPGAAGTSHRAQTGATPLGGGHRGQGTHRLRPPLCLLHALDRHQPAAKTTS